MNQYTIPAYILPSEHLFCELRAVEVRFNDCHDPITGRFASKSRYSNALSENPYNEGKNNRTIRPTDITAYAGGGTSKNGLTKSSKSSKIKATQKQIDDFKKEFIGTKVVNGVVITDAYDHIVDRMIQRKVPASKIKRVLADAKITFPGNKSNRHCVQDEGIRIVFEDNGVLVTVIEI